MRSEKVAQLFFFTSLAVFMTVAGGIGFGIVMFGVVFMLAVSE